MSYTCYYKDGNYNVGDVIAEIEVNSGEDLPHDFFKWVHEEREKRKSKSGCESVVVTNCKIIR